VHCRRPKTQILKKCQKIHEYFKNTYDCNVAQKNYSDVTRFGTFVTAGTFLVLVNDNPSFNAAFAKQMSAFQTNGSMVALRFVVFEANQTSGIFVRE
jgi:hypothetical protein